MLLVLFCPVSREAIDALPNLKLIGALRAGLENIDVKYATKKGIIVQNIKAVNHMSHVNSSSKKNQLMKIPRLMLI